jgi:ribosomal protein S27E
MGGGGMEPCQDCGSSDIIYMPETDDYSSATCQECGAEWTVEL